MTTPVRPRLEEFFLALLWLIGTGGWGYFGLIGYFGNLARQGEPNFSLIGFILGFFLLCLTVFGLRFILHTFRRLWIHTPAWLDTTASLSFGLTLLLGSLFSLFSLLVTAMHLFNDKISNLIFGEGLAACLGMFILSVIQFVTALHAFEPFVGGTLRNHTVVRPLKPMLQFFYGSKGNGNRAGDQTKGPLLLENDSRTGLIDEKGNGRPGLEKTLVAHGGYHVTTLGFTANGAVIFTVSDGGTVHFQAGGRKGTMFPPELKFWDWSSGRVQTAAMGSPQTFLTQDYKTPPSLQDYRFLVPAGGSRFAWVRPDLIQVGNWSNDETQKLNVEDGLVLQGWGGFRPIAFNPEGSRLAWCSTDGQTRLWNLETEQVQPLRAYPPGDPPTPTGTAGGAWGLVFSPDGTRIATLGGQGILLQNVYTGWRWFRPLDDREERLTAFSFSNSGFEMAIGLMARPVAIRSGRPGRKSNSNNGHQPPAEALTGRDPDQFLPIIRLWDLREDRYSDLLVGDSPLRELAYSPDNRLLAAVDETGLLRLWEVPFEGGAIRPPRLVSQLDLGLSGRKIMLTFTPDVQRLICATDNRVMMWNLARLREQAPV